MPDRRLIYTCGGGLPAHRLLLASAASHEPFCTGLLYYAPPGTAIQADWRLALPDAYVCAGFVDIQGADASTARDVLVMDLLEISSASVALRGGGEYVIVIDGLDGNTRFRYTAGSATFAPSQWGELVTVTSDPDATYRTSGQVD